MFILLIGVEIEFVSGGGGAIRRPGCGVEGEDGLGRRPGGATAAGRRMLGLADL